MPLRAEYRELYKTPAWEEARELVRARAGDRCERCRKRNGSYYQTSEPLCFEGFDATRTVLVQCGASHIEHDAVDRFYELSNLLWLCRRCHLLFDRDYHALSFHRRLAFQKFVAALTERQAPLFDKLSACSDAGLPKPRLPQGSPPSNDATPPSLPRSVTSKVCDR